MIWLATDYSGTYFLVSGYRGGDGTWKRGTIPVYRLYNKVAQRPYHYWTTDWGEYIRLGGTWTKEGVAFWLTSDADTQVYRLYNPNDGNHMFTTSVVEYEEVMRAGWNGEGVAFKADSSGNVPVYRLYDPNGSDHMFTASSLEADTLRRAGWSDEGVAFWTQGYLALDVCVDLCPGDDVARTALLGYRQSQRFRLRRSGDDYTLWSCYSNLGISPVYTGSEAEVREALDGPSSKWVTWGIEQVGSATIDGVECDTVRLVSRGDGKALATASTQRLGDATRTVARGSGADQQWALVPEKVFRDGGLYELRLMADTSLALDVTQGSPADGTNVMVHSAGGGNNQKFFLKNEGNGWSLRDISSGKMVDVTGGKLASGTNVQIYRDNDSRAQRWSIKDLGVGSVGRAAAEVVQLGAGNADSYLLTAVAGASNANVTVEAADAGIATRQRWALVATSATDANVPVPTEPYLSSAVGRHESGDRAYQERLYPSWTCTDAWLTGANSYELEYRIRYMPRYGTSYGAWGGWVRSYGPFTTRGTTTWLTEGVDTSFDTAAYKACQVQMRVRVRGTGQEAQVVGAWSYATRANICIPHLTWGAAGLSYEGLTLAYDSDHDGGTTHVYVTSVLAGGRELLAREASGDSGARDRDGSVTVPYEDMTGASVSEGQSLTVTYQVGSELVRRWTWRTWSATVTVSANTGTDDIGPLSVTQGPHHSLLVRASCLGTSGCWFVTDRAAEPMACSLVSEDGGTAVWEAEVPMGRPVTIMYATRASDGDRWAVRTAESAGVPLVPIHVIDWTDVQTGERRHAEIRYSDGDRVAESRTITPDHTEVTLLGRTNHEVTFPGSHKGELNAEGVLLDGLSDADVWFVESLERAGRARYRSPSGGVYDVAVTQVGWTARPPEASVKVSMVEVTA